jgi:hypothetical protein
VPAEEPAPVPDSSGDPDDQTDDASDQEP